MEERVLFQRERDEGRNTPKMAELLFAFGKSYIEIERWDRAQTLLQRAKEIYQADASTFQEDIELCEKELERIPSDP